MGKWAWGALIGIGALVVFSVYVLPGMLFGSFIGGFAPWARDTNRLEDGLVYVSLGDFTADVTPLDAVALYDEGRTKDTPAWYLIADPAKAAQAQFGFPKSRFLDALAGQHVTTYCASHGVTQGKIVWALSAGKVAKARVYCARRRMDLSQLIPLAVPVQNNDRTDLTASAYAELSAQIAASDSMWPSILSEIEPYSHRCAVLFPYIWSAPNLVRPGTMRRMEDTIEQAIEAAIGTQGYALEVRSGYASSYVMHAAEGKDTSVEGWAVDTPFVWLQDGEEVRKAPGMSLYRPEVRFKGSAEECTQVLGLDFSDAVEDVRDMQLLQQVWQSGVSQPKNGGGAAPQVPVLKQDGLQITPTQEITYRLQYFEVAQEKPD